LTDQIPYAIAAPAQASAKIRLVDILHSFPTN
jgi:hypothetical protein